MKIDASTAPAAPNRISPTADSDMLTSLNPNGFIRKLALAPKMRKVP
jgi:hypothetical protein